MLHAFRLLKGGAVLLAGAALGASALNVPVVFAQGTYMGEAQRVTTVPGPAPYGAPAGPSGYGPPPNYPPPSYPAPGYGAPSYGAPNYPVDANAPGPDYAPGMAAQPGTQGAAFAQDELDSLVAPIALYPDQLLAQLLMAATFPLDIVEAARFVRDNPNLSGRALDDAVAAKRWDPSVLSLVAFPQVLGMMNERLDWTRRLGEAFLAEQDRVMQTVQDLRFRAQQAGNLQPTPQQNVIVQDRAIYIEPAQPDTVYVPVYNPTVVYGSWWAPAYVPWYWRPAGVFYSGAIGFYGGYRVGVNHWGWARPDWHQRHITVDLTRPNRFIERRPYYRAWVHDGRWDARGAGSWQSRNGYRPPGDNAVGRGAGRVGPGPRVDGRTAPERPSRVVGAAPRESGNESGMGQQQRFRSTPRGAGVPDAPANAQARGFRAPPPVPTSDAGAPGRAGGPRAAPRERPERERTERGGQGEARHAERGSDGRGRGEGKPHGEGRER